MENISSVTADDYYSELDGGGDCPYPVLNLTDERTAESYMLNALTGRAILVAMFAILAVGVPGNVAFLVTVFRVQSMRNATNMYLTSLAVVDLAFLSVSIFTYFFYFNNTVRTHLTTAGVVGCTGAFVLPYFTYFLSISTVTLVTLDKYNAVCNPVGYIQRRNRLRALRLIAGSWVVAVLLTGLVSLRFARLVRFCAVWPDAERYRGLPVLLGYCVAVSAPGLIVGHLAEAVVFVVALVVDAVMYARIILRLSARVKRKQHERHTAHSQASQVRNQVSRLLITFGTVFFLCQSPFVIISLANIVDYLLGTPAAVAYRRYVLPLTISHVFVFLNSAINPVIYNLTSRIYRQAFRQTVCCCPCTRQNLDDSNLSLSVDKAEPSNNYCFENRLPDDEHDVEASDSKL